MSCQVKRSEILYMGTLIPQLEFNKLLSIDNTPQIATHLFSWKLINAIRINDSYDLSIISTRPISEFPNCRIIYNHKKKWRLDNIILQEMFFINLPILKTFTLLLSSLIYSFKWVILTRKVNRKCVFLDNYQIPYLLTGFIISRICKIPLICVLTDPPNMTYKIHWESYWKKKFRKLNDRLSKKLLLKLHGVISMTSYLAHDYCHQIDHLIIEAIGEIGRAHV